MSDEDFDLVMMERRVNAFIRLALSEGHKRASTSSTGAPTECRIEKRLDSKSTPTLSLTLPRITTAGQGVSLHACIERDLARFKPPERTRMPLFSTAAAPLLYTASCAVPLSRHQSESGWVPWNLCGRTFVDAWSLLGLPDDVMHRPFESQVCGSCPHADHSGLPLVAITTHTLRIPHYSPLYSRLTTAFCTLPSSKLNLVLLSVGKLCCCMLAAAAHHSLWVEEDP